MRSSVILFIVNKISHVMEEIAVNFFSILQL